MRERGIGRRELRRDGTRGGEEVGGEKEKRSGEVGEMGEEVRGG